MSLRLFDLDGLLDRYLARIPPESRLENLKKLTQTTSYTQLYKGLQNYLINGGFDLENPSLMSELRQVATNKLNNVKASSYLDNIIEKDLQTQRSEQEIRGARAMYTSQAVDRSMDRFLSSDEYDQQQLAEIMGVDQFDKLPKTAAKRLMLTSPNIFYPFRNAYPWAYNLQHRLKKGLRRRELMEKLTLPFDDLDPKFVAKFDIQPDTWDAVRRNLRPQSTEEYLSFPPASVSPEF